MFLYFVQDSIAQCPPVPCITTRIREEEEDFCNFFKIYLRHGLSFCSINYASHHKASTGAKVLNAEFILTFLLKTLREIWLSKIILQEVLKGCLMRIKAGIVVY